MRRAATRLRSSWEASLSISTRRSPVTDRSKALIRLVGNETTSAMRFNSAWRARKPPSGAVSSDVGAGWDMSTGRLRPVGLTARDGGYSPSNSAVDR